MLVAASNMGRQGYHGSRSHYHHQQNQQLDDRAQEAFRRIQDLRALLEREEQSMNIITHRFRYDNKPNNTHHCRYDNDAISNPNSPLPSIPFSMLSRENFTDRCLPPFF